MLLSRASSLQLFATQFTFIVKVLLLLPHSTFLLLCRTVLPGCKSLTCFSYIQNTFMSSFNTVTRSPAHTMVWRHCLFHVYYIAAQPQLPNVCLIVKSTSSQISLETVRLSANLNRGNVVMISGWRQSAFLLWGQSAYIMHHHILTSPDSYVFLKPSPSCLIVNFLSFCIFLFSPCSLVRCSALRSPPWSLRRRSLSSLCPRWSRSWLYRGRS